MKFYAGLLIGFLTFAPSFAIAQDRAVAPAPETAITHATPAMWRVADEDSEFILLGTFHILPPNLQWRTPAINQAIENAQTVYFEVDAETPEARSKAIGVIMTQGFLPPGETLSKMLDENDADELNRISNSLGLSLAGVDPMRPWNAFLTLSVQFIVKQGFDPGAGVDSVLLAEARARGKDIEFLESIEQQLSLFTGLDRKTEKDLLVLTIRDWDAQVEAFDSLYAAWATGDADVIDSEMNGMMRTESPKVFDRLIKNRNESWVEILDTALAEGSGTALVAVGAGHLVGDTYSVPSMLAQRGYDVSRFGESAPPDETAEIDPSSSEDDVAPPDLSSPELAIEAEPEAANDNEDSSSIALENSDVAENPQSSEDPIGAMIESVVDDADNENENAPIFLDASDDTNDSVDSTNETGEQD